jgi:hypothetical protein
MLCSKRTLRPTEMSQASVMKALVSTAAMVRSLTPNIVEPVARCGGGGFIIMEFGSYYLTKAVVKSFVDPTLGRFLCTVIFLMPVSLKQTLCYTNKSLLCP